jgi:hypothetical protein
MRLPKAIEPIYGKLKLVRGEIEGTRARLDREYDVGNGSHTLFGRSHPGIRLKAYIL